MAAVLLTALVAEPASKSAGRQQTLLHEQEPPAVPGGSFTSYSNQPSPARVFFQRRSLVADDLLQAVAAGHHVSIVMDTPSAAATAPHAFLPTSMLHDLLQACAKAAMWWVPRSPNHPAMPH